MICGSCTCVHGGCVLGGADSCCLQSDAISDSRLQVDDPENDFNDVAFRRYVPPTVPPVTPTVPPTVPPHRTHRTTHRTRNSSLTHPWRLQVICLVRQKAAVFAAQGVPYVHSPIPPLSLFEPFLFLSHFGLECFSFWSPARALITCPLSRFLSPKNI